MKQPRPSYPEWCAQVGAMGHDPRHDPPAYQRAYDSGIDAETFARDLNARIDEQRPRSFRMTKERRPLEAVMVTALIVAGVFAYLYWTGALR